jgi:gliding motility-associated-like protein
MFLKAFGAYDYTWSTGSKADSVEISAPGGIFWLLGRSSTGCICDTVYKRVGEEPDWEFVNQSDTVLCEGSKSTLKVSGAAGYLWNTGDTTNSITVTNAGNYQVTGFNKRGCEKSLTLGLVQYPLPKVDFTLSATTLDKKHNELICTVPEQPNVLYGWNMGDGSTENGSTIRHLYHFTPSTPEFLVTLTATNSNGCTDSASAIVDVVPFVPNVFSPNGDGINDVFMTGFDSQVFDRNGLILFEGTTGWDGNYHGRKADPDTYFYLIKYTDRNQQVHTLRGYITLVR